MPSWKTGFARSAHESASPGLWSALRGLWLPLLGPSGSVVPDISPYRADATYNSYLGSQWVEAPRFGYGLAFDGSADYLNIPDQAHLRPEQGSWSAMLALKSSSSSVFWNALNKRNTSSPFESWGVAQCESWVSGTNGTRFGFGLYESGTVRRVYRTASSIATGGYQCIVVVGDRYADVLRCYIDGREVTFSSEVVTGVWPTVNNTDPIRIANNNSTGYYPIPVLSAVGMWARALNPNEGKALSEDPSFIVMPRARRYVMVPTAGGTVPYWAFGPSQSAVIGAGVA